MENCRLTERDLVGALQMLLGSELENNSFKCDFLSNMWSILKRIKWILCVYSSLWMRLGSITMTLNQNKSLKSSLVVRNEFEANSCPEIGEKGYGVSFLGFEWNFVCDLFARRCSAKRHSRTNVKSV